MKSLLTPKWIFLVGVLLVLTGISYVPTREDMTLIGSLLLAGWLSIAIHELGHVIFGKWSGFEFGFFTVGPLQFEQKTNGVKLKENKRWLYVGGVAMMIPPKVKKETLLQKWGVFVAGGPILTFMAGIVSILFYEWSSYEFFLFHAIMNGGILFATIVPLKTSMPTDGYVLLTLIKKNEEASKLMDDLLIMKELLGRKHPLDWEQDFIQKAKQKEATIENMQYGLMSYYYEIEQHGFQSAAEAMAPYREIPITKQNKSLLGFLIHMDQLSHYLQEDVEIEEIVHLQKSLSSIEPVSYYRGKAIIAHLKNNQEEKLKYLTKVKKVINENETLYGFYQAEKTLTKLVEDKMAS